MSEDPKPESSEDDAEFERVLRNLVNTPHKPHQTKQGTGEPTPHKVSGEKRSKSRD
jgi:hypothetical protein